MKRLLSILFILILRVGVAGGAEPFCHIATYDENSGLSQHLVKQIVADNEGMMWFATWNGINRFDGYEFAVLKPGVNDGVRRYSSRFRDLLLSAGGDLWCRIDEHVVLLDTKTYRFRDVHNELEEKLGRKIVVDQWYFGKDNSLVLQQKDGDFIVLPNEDVQQAFATSIEPERRQREQGIRPVKQIGEYHDLAYSQRGVDGSLWGVTRRGQVVYSKSVDSPARVISDMGLNDESVRFSTLDLEGNLWFVSSKGAHCVTLSELPYDRIAPSDGRRILAMSLDKQGHIWVSDREDERVAVYSPDFKTVSYLTPGGKIVDTPVSFGRSIYSIYHSPDGLLWLGSKPDGLFRLRPSASGYEVQKICDGNIYDTLLDSRGRLWVATLGDGIKIVENPNSDAPKVTSLASSPNYPREAKSCRRLLAEGDSLMLAATTGGLLAMDINSSTTGIKLYVSTPGDAESLGCVAVMDLLHDASGRLFVATESDAVNLRSIADDGLWRFSNLWKQIGAPSEVALSISPTAGKDGLLVVSHNLVYTVDSANTLTTYGPSFWKGNIRFRELRPLPLPSGNYLFGLEDGLIASDISSFRLDSLRLKPVFTSVSIENRPDSLLSASTRTLALSKEQRNVTLHFSALSHTAQSEITYEFRLRDGEWTRLGSNRSITLLDLEPGKYTLDVRAVDASGRQGQEFCRLELTVEPKFHETTLAKTLFVLLILLAVFLAIRLIIYIRTIKRKQSETLEAYMALLAKSAPKASEAAASPTPNTPSAPEQRTELLALPAPKEPQINEADRRFMDKIVEYVNTHLSDSLAGVDGMAEAAAVSRSGLSRKMRSITGVSPADFLKQARLNHSIALLTSTDLTIKEIAFECGFADLNYFGKCFKQAYSLTPTAYRNSHPEGGDAK